MKNFFRNKKIALVFFIEIFIVGLYVLKIFSPLMNVEIPYDRLEYASGEVINNKGLYIDQNYENNGFFVYGPFFNVKNGIYDITIDYEADGYKNYLFVSGNNLNYDTIYKDDFCLNPSLNTQTFSVWANKKVINFSVNVIYNNEGHLLVKNIAIKENFSGRIYAFVKMMFLISLVNIVIFAVNYAHMNKINEKNLKKVFLILGIIIFSSIPLFTSFLTAGDDLEFHLLRIEGLKEGILAGQFPVRIQPFQFRGYGYASSLFYGDLLLYFPVLLRFLGFPLQDAYKIFVFSVNIATTLISYFCFLGIFKNKKVSMICCMAYVLAPYRLTNIYVRSAVGEYSAMIFWPLIAYALYRLFTQELNDKKYKNIWIYLTIGYSGLIQTHVLSCEIAAVVSVIICMVMLKKTFRKQTILQLVKFFVATVLLNASFLVPLLDSMIKGGVLVTDFGSLQTSRIQGNGIYPAQLFNLFVNGSGMAYGHSIQDYKVLGMSGEMGTTIGLSLLFSIVFFAYLYLVYYNRIKDNKLYKLSILMFIAGILSLYMSTVIFPWDSLCRAFGKLVYNMQFPWRLLSVATVFLTILLGCSLIISEKLINEQSYKAVIMTIVLLTIVTSGYMIYDRLNTSRGIYTYDGTAFADKGSASLNEYLLSETDVDLLNVFEPQHTDNILINFYEKKYTNIKLNVTETNKKAGSVVVPLIGYAGYKAVGENGQNIELSKNQNGILTLSIPAGYNGNVSLSYAGMWYWRAAEVISFISLIIFLAGAIKCTANSVDKYID